MNNYLKLLLVGWRSHGGDNALSSMRGLINRLDRRISAGNSKDAA